MNNEQLAARTSAAVISQLNAEMSAHEYNVKSLAAAVEMDYNTFRRYMNGERELPMPVLWATLSTLGVDIDVFTTRAKERIVRD